MKSAMRQQVGAFFRAALTALPFLIAVGLGLRTGIWSDKLRPVLAGGFDEIGEQQESLAKSRAAYLVTVQMRSPTDVVWQLPVRVVYLLYSPFPWMFSQLADLLGLLDSFMYLTLTAIVLRWWRATVTDSQTRVLTLVIGFSLIVFAVGTSNYGTAIRHRAKFAPVIIALAASAWSIGRRPDRDRVAQTLAHA
jgi:hypothetical protein